MTRLPDDVREVAAAEQPRSERAQRAADLVRAATGYRWVGIYDVTEAEVVNLAWSGPGPPAHPRFPVGAGLTGAAIASRAPVVSNDVAADPRYLTTLESTGSELIVPVVADDLVVGTLDVESDETNAFGDDDVTTLERVAEALMPLFA